MSKIEHDRPRHVALALGEPLDRRTLQDVLRRAWQAAGHGGAIHVTRTDGRHAFVRVEAGAERALRQLLGQPIAGPQGPLRLTTLATSGTLRALSAQTGLLPVRG